MRVHPRHRSSPSIIRCHLSCAPSLRALYFSPLQPPQTRLTTRHCRVRSAGTAAHRCRVALSPLHHRCRRIHVRACCCRPGMIGANLGFRPLPSQTDATFAVATTISWRCCCSTPLDHVDTTFTSPSHHHRLPVFVSGSLQWCTRRFGRTSPRCGQANLGRSFTTTRGLTSTPGRRRTAPSPTAQ